MKSVDSSHRWEIDSTTPDADATNNVREAAEVILLAADSLKTAKYAQTL
ncbi:unnamed protein product [Gongylonema pulchrum]|uniref:DUF3077 domain-containing protein n=1 Tax=Gongylonema pulchrum TaxID=637853 RepID=A0A183DHV0_9BILA|nr:unnamed protein product [Gongylonema pulchrum]